MKVMQLGRFGAVRLTAALIVILTAATACDQSRVQGPTSEVALAGSGANLWLGNAVRLNSPSEFTAGASTHTFEGLVPPPGNYVMATNQFPTLSFSDDAQMGTYIVEQSSILAFPLSFPLPSGTGGLVVYRTTLEFAEPKTEVGMYATMPGIATHNTPVPFYVPIVLRAFDASGNEIGSVSDQLLVATPEIDPGYRPVFIGIRTSTPMARLRIESDYDTDPSDGMAARSTLLDNLMAYPPLPPAVPPVLDTDGDDLNDPVDRCPTQNPGAYDANHDGCTDTMAGAGTLITSFGLPSNTTSSLMSKLDGATSKIASGQVTAAKNQLNALINEIRAQRGKSIPTSVADQLIAYLQNVIASL